MNNLNPIYENLISQALKYSIKKGYDAGRKGFKNFKNRIDLEYGNLDDLETSDIPSMQDIDDISDLDDY